MNVQQRLNSNLSKATRFTELAIVFWALLTKPGYSQYMPARIVSRPEIDNNKGYKPFAYPGSL